RGAAGGVEPLGEVVDHVFDRGRDAIEVPGVVGDELGDGLGCKAGRQGEDVVHSAPGLGEEVIVPHEGALAARPRARGTVKMTKGDTRGSTGAPQRSPAPSSSAG